MLLLLLSTLNRRSAGNFARFYDCDSVPAIEETTTESDENIFGIEHAQLHNRDVPQNNNREFLKIR